MAAFLCSFILLLLVTENASEITKRSYLSIGSALPLTVVRHQPLLLRVSQNRLAHFGFSQFMFHCERLSINRCVAKVDHVGMRLRDFGHARTTNNANIRRELTIKLLCGAIYHVAIVGTNTPTGNPSFDILKMRKNGWRAR